MKEQVVFAATAVALVFAVFSGFHGALADCGTSTFNRPPSQNGTVGVCIEYKSRQCCNMSRASELAFNKSVHGGDCAVPSSDCLAYSRAFACGLQCSPEQSTWTSPQGRVTICKTLADRMYEACKNAESNVAWLQTPPRTKADCVIIGQQWRDGTEYLEALRLNVSATNTNCLDASGPALSTSTGPSGTSTSEDSAKSEDDGAVIAGIVIICVCALLGAASVLWVKWQDHVSNSSSPSK
jgi:Folate receptor family